MVRNCEVPQKFFSKLLRALHIVNQENGKPKGKKTTEKKSNKI